MEKNLWRSPLVTKAYSYQQEAPPYLDLIKTTESFIGPMAGEKWLDLGCGSGRLIKCIWEKSQGRVDRIVGIDISYAALVCAKRSIEKLSPVPGPARIQLAQADFSRGLGKLVRPSAFDGVTAGLSIAYADHWDPHLRRWDNRSYLQLLRDIFILLKSGGSFIFSSNVPNPNFRRIALDSWREIFLTWKAPLHMAVSSIMLYQSHWLKQCAKEGRFHYLPADEVITNLQSVGFKVIKCELTYARQAWVFSAVKQ